MPARLPELPKACANTSAPVWCSPLTLCGDVFQPTPYRKRPQPKLIICREAGGRTATLGPASGVFPAAARCHVRGAKKQAAAGERVRYPREPQAQDQGW
eukprot:scaffold1788_cov396-Prasinococcus_capsulatus_cf.AAC.3